MSTDVLFGFHSIIEALRAGRRRFDEIMIDRRRTGGRLRQLLAEVERHGIPIATVSSKRLGEVTASVHHQGIAARVSSYPYAAIEEMMTAAAAEGPPAFLLVLDSIVDPHNLGAILRTALCAGVDGVVIAKDRSAAATPVVSRVSAGALEHVRLARVTNLVRAIQAFKQQGVWVVGMTGRSAADLYGIDLSLPLAIVIGGEEKGLRPLLKKKCDFMAAIPMSGPLDSLNASAAAAVALYEARRQRCAATHTR